MAYSDLGGLGTKQGPPVYFVWTVPVLLPLMLPWLAVLGLLALPSNRNGRAWWIWAPLGCLALLGAGLEPHGEELSYSVQAACAAAFGLAAIWLLGAGLARRCRAVSIVLMALAFAAVSLLAFAVSPMFEQLWDLRRYESALPFYLLLLWIGSGLVISGALNLTGWICRKRFGRRRASLWLLPCLWVIWLVVLGLFGCVMVFCLNENFEWKGFLVGTVVLSLVSYAIILPFLLLSFTNSFYRGRLKDLLRLPAADASPPVANTAPISDREVGALP